jgi:hypothetical protein
MKDSRNSQITPRTMDKDDDEVAQLEYMIHIIEGILTLVVWTTKAH